MMQADKDSLRSQPMLVVYFRQGHNFFAFNQFFLATPSIHSIQYIAVDIQDDFSGTNNSNQKVNEVSDKGIEINEIWYTCFDLFVSMKAYKSFVDCSGI